MNNKKEIKYLITNLDCPTCATSIEVELEEMGIKANCDYHSCEITFISDDTKTNKKVLEYLKKSGYKIK